jgi:hypothetical protein
MTSQMVLATTHLSAVCIGQMCDEHVCICGLGSRLHLCLSGTWLAHSNVLKDGGGKQSGLLQQAWTSAVSQEAC